MKILAEVSILVGKSDRLLVLLCDFSPKNMPMPNDAYYATFPLRIADIPAVDITE
jgi:hypothetical protein